MPAAYQDQNGKWWKECSSTKQLFGPVDNKEDLSEWFHKDKSKLNDGFRTYCKIIAIENNKKWRVNNPEKEKEKQKRNYSKYSDKRKVKNRLYRQNNVEKIKQYRQKENVKSLKNAYDKKYRKSAAGLYAHYKRSAKLRGINFVLTNEWFEEQMKLPQFNTCAISEIKFVEESNHPLSRSLDRISSSKGYTPDNVRWVCFKYNSWKGDLTLKDVSLIFKYMAESTGYNPVEYMREVMNNNSTPHLTLMKESA
jgi:hypothetical protein